MRIGHPHMVGWGLAALNVLVVPFAREYREFCSSRPPSATIGSKSIAEFNGLRSNSLRIGTGNLIRPCRELIRAIREFFCLIRNPALAAISLRGKTECPTNSRMMSRVPEGDEVHLSGADPQAHRPART